MLATVAQRDISRSRVGSGADRTSGLEISHYKTWAMSEHLSPRLQCIPRNSSGSFSYCNELSTGEKSTFLRRGKCVDSLLKGTLSIKISSRRKGFGKAPIQSPERLMGLLCPRKGVLPKTFLLCELFRKFSSFPQTFLAAEKFISSQCI